MKKQKIKRKITDKNLKEKILEANGDFDKLCDIKREYMKGVDTSEERLKRTHMFCYIGSGTKR